MIANSNRNIRKSVWTICCWLGTILTLVLSSTAFVGSFIEGAPPIRTFTPFVVLTALMLALLIRGVAWFGLSRTGFTIAPCALLLIGNACSILLARQSLLVFVLFD